MACQLGVFDVPLLGKMGSPTPCLNYSNFSKMLQIHEYKDYGLLIIRSRFNVISPNSTDGSKENYIPTDQANQIM